MPYEKLVRDIKDILVSHAPEIFNTNMTESFKAKAREWLATEPIGTPLQANTVEGVVGMFAAWLDQEAQEKHQQPECEHTFTEEKHRFRVCLKDCGFVKDFGIKPAPSLPQQPEEIEFEELEVQWASDLAQRGDIRKLNANLIKIGTLIESALNRLTHNY